MIYLDMLSHWAGLLRGNSYWHQPQGLGSQFQAGKLNGYFNDLSRKASWPGTVDERGLPLNNIGGRLVYWPTTVLQKGLAHWDLALSGAADGPDHRQKFDTIVGWIVATQDEWGGWPYPIPLHRDALSKYSCIAQGQAVSILVRSWLVTGDFGYLTAARQGLDAMLKPVSEGGCAIYDGDSLQLEEHPSPDGNTVLNGWIFGLYGMHDYLLAVKDPSLEERLDTTLRTLALQLAMFDCGFWSRYDAAGNLASPFYHDLHIAQLGALAQTFPRYRSTFENAAKRFEQYSKCRVNRVRAIARKAAQKLIRPPITVLHT